MTKAEKTDEWLMQQVRKGNAESIEPLIRSHGSGLLTYLVRSIQDRHRAEELFQEVFQRVWAKRKSYKHPMPFKPWLYTIAANLVRSEYRKRKISGADVMLDSIQGAANSPDQSMINEETSEMLNKATKNLPPQQRQILTLRIWNELSYAEIAKMLGVAEATARANMHHALKSLRQTLQQDLFSGVSQ